MTDNKLNKRIEFSPIFDRQIASAPAEIIRAFREAYELFSETPHHPALRNHILSGKYAGWRSIDVTDDWRALYREESERILFMELGTHPQLYG
jgi:addiction module RelE/StbE family toxin